MTIERPSNACDAASPGQGLAAAAVYLFHDETRMQWIRERLQGQGRRQTMGDLGVSRGVGGTGEAPAR